MCVLIESRRERLVRGAFIGLWKRELGQRTKERHLPRDMLQSTLIGHLFVNCLHTPVFFMASMGYTSEASTKSMVPFIFSCRKKP